MSAKRRRRPWVVAASVALVVLAATSSSSRGRAAAGPDPVPAAAPRCERAVVVIVGAVRPAEFLGRPDLVPTVAKIAAAGFSARGWRAGGADHGAALEAILTGRTPRVVTGPRARGAWPTVLEYARRGLALEARGAWYASYADGDELLPASSAHAEYGEAVAPSLAHGDGPFGEPLRGLFRRFGRPMAVSDARWEVLARLREATGKEAAARGVPGALGPASKETLRVERALLEEVDLRGASLGGKNPQDARALRAALTVLRLFRPRLLVVRLGEADVAHKDLYAYWDVLRANDAAIGRLRDHIASDPVMRGRTALIVTTETGRNEGQNAAGGYDHDDASEERSTIAVVGEGPGFRRGVFGPGKAGASARDLCPTLGRAMGFPTPYAEGSVREELLVR